MTPCEPNFLHVCWLMVVVFIVIVDVIDSIIILHGRLLLMLHLKFCSEVFFQRVQWIIG